MTHRIVLLKTQVVLLEERIREKRGRKRLRGTIHAFWGMKKVKLVDRKEMERGEGKDKRGLREGGGS